MTPHDNIQPDYRTQDGFSLLELVVAVSIMLVLGTVGTVSYQTYTENARKANAESAAIQVATAIVAADDSPGEDAIETLESYNDSSPDVSANITATNDEAMTITSQDRNDTYGSVTIPGDYSHLPVTNYSGPGISYGWEGEPHNSVSHKYLDGEIVASNLAMNPSFEFRNGGMHYQSGASDIDIVDDWSLSGDQSIRHWSNFTNYYGSAYIDVASFKTPKGLDRGKTYTMYAEVKKDHAHEEVGSLRLVAQKPDKSTYIEASTTRAPAESGVHRLRMVFEVPEDNLGWYLRLHHRGVEGEPPIHWDNIMLLEGDVEYEYFDGDSL